MLLLHMAGETFVICVVEAGLSRKYGVVQTLESDRTIRKLNINIWLYFFDGGRTRPRDKFSIRVCVEFCLDRCVAVFIAHLPFGKTCCLS